MNYIQTVAELFLKRNGKKFLEVSDYSLIAEWEKEEIPLKIVLNSINRIFDDLSAVYESVESIEYFEEIIQIDFAEHIRQKSYSKTK